MNSTLYLIKYRIIAANLLLPYCLLGITSSFSSSLLCLSISVYSPSGFSNHLCVCVSTAHALHHLIVCYICMNVKIFDFSKHIDLVPILVKLFGVFDKSYFSKIKIAIYRRKCWIYSLYNGKWIFNLKPQINNKRTIWIGTKILGVLCEFSKFNLLFVLLHN